MRETAILIERGEVTWQCWLYLCTKCGEDPFRARSLCLYTTRAHVVATSTLKRCETCGHLGWSMPQCHECTDENGRKWWTPKE